MRDDLIARLGEQAGRLERSVTDFGYTGAHSVVVDAVTALREAAAALTAHGETAPAQPGDNGSGFCVQCCLPMGSHRLQCPRDVQPAASPLPAAEWLDPEIRALLVRADSYLSLLWHRHTYRAAREDTILAYEVDQTLTALRAVAEGRR